MARSQRFWVFQSEYAPRPSLGELVERGWDWSRRNRNSSRSFARGCHAAVQRPRAACALKALPAETSILQVMSAELIAILAVGVALGGLLTSLRGISDRLGKVEERFGGVEQRVVRLEGLLEGSGLFCPVEAPESGAGD